MAVEIFSALVDEREYASIIEVSESDCWSRWFGAFVAVAPVSAVVVFFQAAPAFFRVFLSTVIVGSSFVLEWEAASVGMDGVSGGNRSGFVTWEAVAGLHGGHF